MARAREVGGVVKVAFGCEEGEKLSLVVQVPETKIRLAI